MKIRFILIVVMIFTVQISFAEEQKIPDEYKVKDSDISANIDREVLWLRNQFLDRFANKRLNTHIGNWLDRFPDKKSKIEVSYLEVARLNGMLFEMINIGIENTVTKLTGSNLKMQLEISKLRLDNAKLKKASRKERKALEKNHAALDKKYKAFLKKSIWSD